jgi:hypothetical protein
MSPDTALVTSQEGSGVLAMRLADLLENARPVPLLRDRVRVDRREVYRLVETVNESMRSEVADHQLDKAAAYDLMQATNDLREAVTTAYPVPLTDQVRLPRGRAIELAWALRAAARL